MKWGAWRVKAMPAKEMASIHCMATIHQRLVMKRSTMGLQKGLMTQGR